MKRYSWEPFTLWLLLFEALLFSFPSSNIFILLYLLFGVNILAGLPKTIYNSIVSSIREKDVCDVKVGIGQDSHRFDFDNENKKLILGGVIFEGCTPLAGNSDADVVLHSITNAVSGVTCVNILGEIADELCFKQGVTNSRVYLEEALKHLNGSKVVHVSVSIECSTPKITPKIPEMRKSISAILEIPENCVGITATTGEGLTAFGQGKGIQVFSCITVI